MLSFSSPAAAAEQINMATTEWEPFYAPTLEAGGVVTEIVTTAFEREGYDAKISWYPWIRAMKMVKHAEIDLVMGAYYSEERARDFHFSAPFFDIDVGFIALKEAGISEYASLRSLVPYTIGVNRGWAYTEAFDNADFLKKDYAVNQILSTRMLFARRVDMVAMSVAVFQHEARISRYHDMSEVVVLSPLLDSKSLHLMVSRSRPDHLKLIEGFNRGLAKIRADGTYGRILAKHGF